MTFKSAQNIFLRKKRYFNSKHQNQNNVSELFNKFLKLNYPDHLVSRLSFNLDYVPERRRLVIQTNSKIFANDLILKLGELNRFLSSETNNIKEIVIK